MQTPSPSCRRLLLHPAESAAFFARFSAGSSIAARIAMMAITTSSSIKVKADAPLAVRFSQCTSARPLASLLFMAIKESQRPPAKPEACRMWSGSKPHGPSGGDGAPRLPSSASARPLAAAQYPSVTNEEPCFRHPLVVRVFHDAKLSPPLSQRYSRNCQTLGVSPAE